MTSFVADVNSDTAALKQRIDQLLNYLTVFFVAIHQSGSFCSQHQVPASRHNFVIFNSMRTITLRCKVERG